MKVFLAEIMLTIFQHYSDEIKQVQYNLVQSSLDPSFLSASHASLLV